MSRVYLKTVLGDAGHPVRSVENGNQALDTVRREPFALSFMNIQMPGTDGIETMHRDRSLPLATLTVFSMHGDRERFLEERRDRMRMSRILIDTEHFP